MNLSQLIDHVRHSPFFRERITYWYDVPAREARTHPYPEWVDPSLVSVLQSRGVKELYTHQYDAVQAVKRGEHVVVVTPTASGKTLCYNPISISHESTRTGPACQPPCYRHRAQPGYQDLHVRRRYLSHGA
jgi:ATP-dependent helicase YprA (DUF1998 family)